VPLDPFCCLGKPHRLIQNGRFHAAQDARRIPTRCVPRHEDDAALHSPPLGLEASVELLPAETGHPEIRHHHVVVCLIPSRGPEETERLLPFGGSIDPVSAACEVLGQDLAYGGLVIDQQDPQRLRWGPGIGGLPVAARR